MKSGKNAAEMCTTSPILDEMEQWKALVAVEACTDRNFKMDAVSVFKICRLLRHVRAKTAASIRIPEDDGGNGYSNLSLDLTPAQAFLGK
eukprot:5838937-Heterocapsa_arctica.AAC.1